MITTLTMRKEDCFLLGYIVRKHGYKGALNIKLDTDEPHLYKKLESVFVEINNALIPFFITQSKLKGFYLRVVFEHITDETTASKLLKSKVYLPLNLLPPLMGNKFYYHEIIDFNLKDVNYGNVGIIKGVDDSGRQALFEVYSENTLILVPIIDDFLVSVDRESQLITVDLPKGFLEMYGIV